MLSCIVISGRQFAHLLIRAHRNHQNHFLTLSAPRWRGRALKRLNLSIEDLIDIASRSAGNQYPLGNAPQGRRGRQARRSLKQLVTSFFEPRHYRCGMKSKVSNAFENTTCRFTSAYLHSKFKIVLSVGNNNTWDDNQVSGSSQLNSQYFCKRGEILNPASLLVLCCARRFLSNRLLDRTGYEIDVRKGRVSPSVAMRRMTVMPPLPSLQLLWCLWTGKLRAVYRGNGIPLLGGIWELVADPCQHWAGVFHRADCSEPHCG